MSPDIAKRPLIETPTGVEGMVLILENRLSCPAFWRQPYLYNKTHISDDMFKT